MASQDMDLSPGPTPTLASSFEDDSETFDRETLRRETKRQALQAGLQSLENTCVKSFFEAFQFPVAIFEQRPLADALVKRVSINRQRNPEDDLANSLSVQSQDAASSLREGRERQRAFKRTRTASARSEASDSADSASTAREFLEAHVAAADNRILLSAFGNPAAKSRTAGIQEQFSGFSGSTADVGTGTSLRELLTPVWANKQWQKLSADSTTVPNPSLLDFLSAEDGKAIALHLQSVLKSGRAGDLLNITMGDSSPVDLAVTMLEASPSPLLVFTLNRMPLPKHSSISPRVKRRSIGGNQHMEDSLQGLHSAQILNERPAPIRAETEVISGFLVEDVVGGKRRRKRRHTEEAETSGMVVDMSRQPALESDGSALVEDNITPLLISESDLKDPFYQILARYETGRIILARDWSATTLGPIEKWSPVAKTVISLAMDSPNRWAVWVGQDMCIMYNDAYISTAGKKHPNMIGQAGAVAWAELWDELGPMALQLQNGAVFSRFDNLLWMERGNAVEETYYSYTWSPVYDSEGRFVCASNQSFETTSRIVAERRLGTLRQLAQITSTAKNVTDYYESTLTALSTNSFDLPFVMYYSCSTLKSNKADKESSSKYSYGKRKIRLHLEGSLGVPQDHPSVPISLSVRLEGSAHSLDESTSTSNSTASASTATGSYVQEAGLVWPFGEALSSRKPVFIPNLGDRTEGFEIRGWDEAARAAVCIPIHTETDSDTQAVLIVGLNPRRPWSEQYAQFLQLLSRQIVTGLVSVRSFEEAHAKAAELAQLDRAKTAFFSNISHELRTPVTLILGPVEDILSDKDIKLESPMRDSLKIVSRNAQRLLNLVNSLLDFSSLEAGRMQATWRAVNFPGYISDLASLFRSAIERAGIEFVVDCPADSRICYVDPSLMEKVLFNILGNAFKYCLKGRITVSTRVSKDKVVFSVKDTGIGIPADELENIFARFHRVQNQGRSQEGSGIGLALTLELVRILHGTLNVESKVDEGSTFSVELPMGKDHVPPDRLTLADTDMEPEPNRLRFGLAMIDEASQWTVSDTVSPMVSDSSSGGSSGGDSFLDSRQLSGALSTKDAVVLIADDNTDMRTYCRNILSKHYTCLEASDGQQAWNLLQSRPGQIDLVLSDVMMPKLDGFSLLRLLREEPSMALVSFILLSARAGEEARVEGLLAGADDYLAKPFASKELLARVHTHVQLSKMRTELEKQVDTRTKALLDSEARSKELAEHFSLVLHTNPAGIFAAATDGTLTFVNAAWRMMSGYDESSITTANWMQAVHPDDRQAVKEIWQNTVVDLKQDVHLFEFRWLHADGKVIWAHMNITSREGLEAGPIIGSIVDTTKIKELEQLHINAVEQRALDADKMRKAQELNVDLASHEIRNPLSALYQNAELVCDSLSRLADGLDSPDTPINRDHLRQELELNLEAGEAIVICSTHLKRICDDILGWSKLSTGLLQLHKTSFHLPSLGKSLSLMFELDASSKGISINLDLDASLDRLDGNWLIADSHRLTQILVNFITNAFKATVDSPTKRVTLQFAASVTMPEQREGVMRVTSPDRQTPISPPADSLYLSGSVIDTGRGLDVADRSKLFRIWSQLDPEVDSSTGFGLGLFVSQKIVELHGGFVEVEGEKGRGTCFRFVVPVRRGEKRDISKEEVQTTGGYRRMRLNRHRSSISNTAAEDMRRLVGIEQDKPKKKMILVVEDNIVNQKVLTRQLKLQGYDTEVASNGREALDILYGIKKVDRLPDCVLMDIEMPILSGLQAIVELRQKEQQGLVRKHPVIAITGNARQEQIDSCKASGFDRVKVKPYSLQDICQNIEELLRIE